MKRFPSGRFLLPTDEDLTIISIEKYNKTPNVTPSWLMKSLAFCILLFATSGIFGFAATQIDLTVQVKGTLPFGNGGTNTTSIAAGIARSSGSALSGAELSGDATTSGSNAVTVLNVNGTSVPTNASADQVVVTTASATGAWKSVPNCTTGALEYATSTHTFSCGSVPTGTQVNNETPSGTINGTTTTFTLVSAPSPATSLHLYHQGQLIYASGVDYTLTTNSISINVAPKTGDVLSADYLH